MKLRVYLDSQDYINLYKNRNSSQQHIFDRLSNHVDNGEIDIIYSFPIIAEFITNFSSEYKADRVERVRFIKRLCNKSAFVSIDKLVTVSDPLTLNGNWTPFPAITPEIIKEIRKPLFNHIRNIQNIAKQNLNKKNFSIKDRIRSNPTLYNLKLPENLVSFPLPDSFKTTNVFMRYICGEIPDTWIIREMQKLFFDLEQFLDIWFDHAKQEDFLALSLRKQSLRYVGIVDKFSNVLLNFEENVKSIEQQINSDLTLSTSKQIVQNTKIELRKAQNLDPSYLRNTLEPGVLKLYPENFFNLVFAYVRHTIKTKKKQLPSDGADLIHASYLPYCDLWRGDRSFSDMLVRERVMGFECVVNDLDKLPAAIESKLAEKNQR